MIRVQSEPFDPYAEAAAFSAGRAEAGALATFTGSVRNTAHGGEVTALELEHYPGFTEAKIAEIEAEARQRFDVIDTLVIHRYGRMARGEPIVFVAALSIHRREALQAIDFLMDRLKTDAPFWKKEVRANGEPEWIEPRSDDREARARWDAGSAVASNELGQRGSFESLFFTESTFEKPFVDGSALIVPIRGVLPLKGCPFGTGAMSGRLVFHGILSSRRKVTEYIGDPKKPDGFRDQYFVEDVSAGDKVVDGANEFAFEGVQESPAAWVDWVVRAKSFDFVVDKA